MTPAPTRRRRRTSSVAARPKGNELFVRCLEEVEHSLSPGRAARVVVHALAEVGTTPEHATMGHCVRALECALPQALGKYCTPDEAAAIVNDLSRVLDRLAGRYFGV